jgi:hypothetical protein
MTADRENEALVDRRGASRWVAVGMLLIVESVGLATMPAGYIALDQVAWHEEARSIILGGNLWVDDSVVDSAKWSYVKNDRDGHYYSKYGLFNGLLHVPPLALELAVTGALPHESPTDGRGSANPTRVLILNLFFVLLSVVIALLLWLASGFYIGSQLNRALFVLMTIYCTTLWHYLRFPFSESTQVALFLLFWLFVLRFSRCEQPLAVRRRDAYWAWFALFLLCETRVADLFILPLFGSYLTWLAWESDLPWPRKAAFLLKTAVVPAALIIAAQGFVHFVKFGSPFLSGYHQYWENPRPHTLWQVIVEFTIHPQWSLFLTFPVLILALPGWWRYLRQHTAEAVFMLAASYGMFAIVEPLPFWRGELAYGPRYFLYLLPVLSLPALYVLEWLVNGSATRRQPMATGRQLALNEEQHPHPNPLPSVRHAHGGRWEREGFVGRGRVWFCRIVMAGTVAVGVFLALAQFQVQRFAFFEWRGGFRNRPAENAEVQAYIDYTPVPKICWDHLRCRDHLEDLPYYEAMARGKTLEEIEAWKRELLSHITYSNLYWFPEINR